MIGCWLLDLIATLASQPKTYWTDPKTADAGYHAFHWFLGSGWQSYVSAQVAFLSVVLAWVAVMPRPVARLTLFTVISGHYFGFAAWLDYVWHLGMAGTFACCAALGFALSAISFEVDTDQIRRRLRWVLGAAMVCDLVNTVLGQPANYWLHPASVDEGFGPSRFLLSQGFPLFLFFDLLGLGGLLVLVSILPRKAGLIGTWLLIFSYYFGASTWLFNRWQLGPNGPLLYGAVLSPALVWIVSCKESAPNVGTIGSLKAASPAASTLRRNENGSLQLDRGILSRAFAFDSGSARPSAGDAQERRSRLDSLDQHARRAPKVLALRDDGGGYCHHPFYFGSNHAEEFRPWKPPRTSMT